MNNLPLKNVLELWRQDLRKSGLRRRHPTGLYFRTWESRAAIFLFIASIISGVATCAALTSAPPFGHDPNTVVWLLDLDVVILLLLLAAIARRIVGLWSRRKKKLAGSRLHVRLVYTFSLMAAAPVIIMTVASAVFFHFGVQTWFSERVKTAINESQAVAVAYYDEHREVIKADVLAMANDLDRDATFLIADEDSFEKDVQTQSTLRGLSEAIVFDSRGHIKARSGLTFSLEFENVSQYALRQASDGDVVITTGPNEDRIRALVKLNNFPDTYLYVGRMADPKVLSHLVATREATEDYADLQKRYSSLEITVTMIFVLVGLIMILMAIWYGLILARQLVSPIASMISAADRVRAGDLTARAPEREQLEEFDYLAGAFNRMTKQIQEQQNDLIEANQQLDRRRRLIESVLTGVSSGVLGVDGNNEINLANASAVELLGLKEKDLVGKKIESIMPELGPLLIQARARPRKTTQGEIPFIESKGAKRAFHVRVVMEMQGSQEVGAILTFDDTTELQSAQRKAAWADVARRIAHEIKNPLTPIQLSAERLKRKYLKFITEDAETFTQYTDTIIRQVGDIGRMVSEFSSFARMPEPVIKGGDLTRDIDETLFMQRQSHTNIAFNFIGKSQGGFETQYDPQLMRQTFQNILQNAVDSVEQRLEKEGSGTEPGKINIFMSFYGDDEIVVAVTDNGLGFPKNENPALLAEPYVTHKTKGTGLGLAIVKKIMEDHGGSLIMGAPDWLTSMEGWEDLGGATVTLVIPLRKNKLNEITAAA